MDSICSMDIIEFCTYLKDKNFDEDIVHRFSKNKICSSTFLILTEHDLKDLLPVIGERVHVRQLLKEAKQVCNYTRYSACWSDVELRELWLEYKDAALIMCVYMCMYVCMYIYIQFKCMYMVFQFTFSELRFRLPTYIL